MTITTWELLIVFSPYLLRFWKHGKVIVTKNFFLKIIKYKINPKYLRLKELGSWYICFRSTWTLDINITQEMFGILEHFAALTPKFNHRWNFRRILCYDLFSHFGLRRFVFNYHVQVNTFNHYHFDFANVFGIYWIYINRLILYIFEHFIPINLMLKKNLSSRLSPGTRQVISRDVQKCRRDNNFFPGVILFYSGTWWVPSYHSIYWDLEWLQLLRKISKYGRPWISISLKWPSFQILLKGLKYMLWGRCWV